MKVGIITQYYNSENYGGLLQAYALNSKINELGVECETISYNGSVNRKFPRFSLTGISLFFKYLIVDFLEIFHSRNKTCEIKNDLDFLEFRDKNITHSSKVYTDKTLVELNDDYDIFVCGSDRIWHTNPIEMMNDVYILSFVKNKKCLAYAASAESNSLSKQEVCFYRKQLKKFDGVSLREKQLYDEFIKKNIFSDVKHVLDPVFLLSANEWDSISINPDIKEPYVFLYALGNNNEELNTVLSIANELNYSVIVAPKSSKRIIKLAQENGWMIPDHCTPLDFIGYISHSKLIISDSFHCTAFSMIYNKEFYIINRDYGVNNSNYIDRITSIFSCVGIDSNIANNRFDYICPDYSEVSENINKLKKYSLDYLIKSIVD